MSSTYTKSAEIPSDEDYRNWGILISGGFSDELEGNGRSVVSTCSSSESSWADYFGEDVTIRKYLSQE